MELFYHDCINAGEEVGDAQGNRVEAVREMKADSARNDAPIADVGDGEVRRWLFFAFQLLRDGSEIDGRFSEQASSTRPPGAKEEKVEPASPFSLGRLSDSNRLFSARPQQVPALQIHRAGREEEGPREEGAHERDSDLRGDWMHVRHDRQLLPGFEEDQCAFGRRRL
jgi:hypothetical protein